MSGRAVVTVPSLGDKETDNQKSIEIVADIPSYSGQKKKKMSF